MNLNQEKDTRITERERRDRRLERERHHPNNTRITTGSLVYLVKKKDDSLE